MGGGVATKYGGLGRVPFACSPKRRSAWWVLELDPSDKMTCAIHACWKCSPQHRRSPKKRS